MKKINEFVSRNIIIVIFVVAILIGILNYVLYPFLVQKEYRMIEVPIAKKEILENTKIDEAMIEYVNVPLSAVKGELTKDIIGKYVLEGSKIVKGGYFYKDLIGDKNKLNENKTKLLNDDEVAISIPLNSISSTNDLISKNQFVDLFFDGEVDIKGFKTKVFGMIADNVRVIETYNSNSVPVEEGNKNYVVLATDFETYSYIKRALILGEVTPVIKYDSYEEKHLDNEFYDIADLRYLIDTNCKVYKRNLNNDF